MPDQLSMFEVFTAVQQAPIASQPASQLTPMPSPQTAPETTTPESAAAESIPVAFQASTRMDSSYAIFGIARAVFAPAFWHPTAEDVLSLFPINTAALDPGAIQGFYFSRPLPVDEFIRFIEKHNNGQQMNT